MSVRCCKGFNGLIYGDIGCVINLDDGEMDDLNVQVLLFIALSLSLFDIKRSELIWLHLQVDWQKKGKAMYAQYLQLEILGVDKAFQSTSSESSLRNNSIEPISGKNPPTLNRLSFRFYVFFLSYRNSGST